MRRIAIITALLLLTAIVILFLYFFRISGAGHKRDHIIEVLGQPGRVVALKQWTATTLAQHQTNPAAMIKPPLFINELADSRLDCVSTSIVEGTKEISPHMLIIITSPFHRFLLILGNEDEIERVYSSDKAPNDNGKSRIIRIDSGVWLKYMGAPR